MSFLLIPFQRKRENLLAAQELHGNGSRGDVSKTSLGGSHREDVPALLWAQALSDTFFRGARTGTKGSSINTCAERYRGSTEAVEGAVCGDAEEDLPLFCPRRQNLAGLLWPQRRDAPLRSFHWADQPEVRLRPARATSPCLTVRPECEDRQKRNCGDERCKLTAKMPSPVTPSWERRRAAPPGAQSRSAEEASRNRDSESLCLACS